VRRTAAITSLLLAAGLTGTVGAGTAQAAPVPPAWDHGFGGERYVAFGDSFVSGPGIQTMRDVHCARSTANFPSIVAQQLRTTAFTDASCGGARTEHYWEPQAVTGGENPAQLDSLGPDTTLVTIGTMGGNDVGLVGLAATCITGDCAGAPDDAQHQAVDALAPTFRQIIDDVRAEAPRATIIAVGYGTYLPETPCAALPGFTSAETVYLQGLIDHLSDTIEDVADEKGVAFADMRDIPGAADHTPCAAADQQWLRGLSTYGDGAIMHPSSLGMRVMADKVLATVQATRGSRARLASAAASLQLDTDCRGGDSRRTRTRVVLRVDGGHGLVTARSFRIGRQVIAVADTTRPWRTKVRIDDLRKHSRGKVRATVTLRTDGLTTTRTLVRKRPACLRR
jgi:lysophospholipase L1-like esterase